MTPQIYAVTNLLVAIFSFVLGLAAFAKQQKSRPVYAFLIFCLSISLWSLFLFLNAISIGPLEALLWVKQLHFIAIFIPISFLFFSYEFLDIDRRYKSWVISLSVIAALVLLAVNLSSNLVSVEYKPEFGFYVCVPANWIYIFYVILFVSVVAFTYYELIRGYFEKTGIKKVQIQYLILSTLIGWSGGISNFLINYGIKIPLLYPFGNATIVVYVALISYVIYRYRLMDIDVIIRRGMLYTATTAVVAALYVSAIYGSRYLLLLFPGASEIWFMLPIIFRFSAIFVLRCLTGKPYRSTIH